MGRCAGESVINTKNVVYVSAEPDDIPMIFAFAKDLVDKYEDVSSIDYEKVLRWMLNKITDNIMFYQCIVFDGIKVGYFHFDSNGQEAELDDLYILPEYRGKGFGTAAIQHCLENANKPVFLYVFSQNTGAIHLYEKMGFVVAEAVGNTRMIMRYGC